MTHWTQGGGGGQSRKEIMNFNIILYTLSRFISSLSRFWSGRLGGKGPINFAQIKKNWAVFFKREWRQFSKQRSAAYGRLFAFNIRVCVIHARIYIIHFTGSQLYYNYDKNMQYWISSRFRFLPFLSGIGSPCLFLRREGLDAHRNQDKTCRNCKPCPDLYKNNNKVLQESGIFTNSNMYQTWDVL
jgi:hypothetical protein